MMKLKIKKISKGIIRHVYDLNVPKNHNFFILEKGILTHNCDYLTINTQTAMRSFMEEFSKNCGFIMTCNYENRIIEPLRNSRFSLVKFTVPNEEKPKLAAAFFKRVVAILKLENVDFDPAVVAKVIEKYFPDFRRTLNELQKHAAAGRIDESVFKAFRNESLDNLFVMLKEKKFNDMRKWVGENSDQDATELYRKMYDMADSKVELKSMPGFVVTMAKYMHSHALVADPEINFAAFLTEIMMECELR